MVTQSNHKPQYLPLLVVVVQLTINKNNKNTKPYQKHTSYYWHAFIFNAIIMKPNRFAIDNLEIGANDIII